MLQAEKVRRFAGLDFEVGTEEDDASKLLSRVKELDQPRSHAGLLFVKAFLDWAHSPQGKADIEKEREELAFPGSEDKDGAKQEEDLVFTGFTVTTKPVIIGSSKHSQNKQHHTALLHTDQLGGKDGQPIAILAISMFIGVSLYLVRRQVQSKQKHGDMQSKGEDREEEHREEREERGDREHEENKNKMAPVWRDKRKKKMHAIAFRKPDDKAD